MATYTLFMTKKSYHRRTDIKVFAIALFSHCAKNNTKTMIIFHEFFLRSHFHKKLIVIHLTNLSNRKGTSNWWMVVCAETHLCFDDYTSFNLQMELKFFLLLMTCLKIFFTSIIETDNMCRQYSAVLRDCDGN